MKNMPSSADTSELPPQDLHPLRETQAPDYPEPYYDKYEPDVPIALDFGSLCVRIGLTNSEHPSNAFPNLVSRHRDRKTGHNLTFVGNDIFREAPFYPTLSTGAKSPFDGLLITNWDYVESILDYSLEHLSITSDNGGLNNPVIMTEPAGATFGYRKGMYEMMFEAYMAPKVVLGIDSLFSFYANSKKKDGIVISLGHNLTYVIPVVQGKGILLNSKRIDWGGEQQLQFLQKALALKYPYFPTRLNQNHTANIIHDHAYVSTDYAVELANYLNLDVLEDKDIVIQVPVEAAAEKAKRTEEELSRQAERRKENKKRLQEQAQKKRLENIAQKEKEFAYYSELRDSFADLSKSETHRRVLAEDFQDVTALHKYLEGLQRSIRRFYNSEEEEKTEEIDPATAWPLADVSDSELNDDDIKEKRRQKLIKSNYEVRMRMKEEKKREEEEKLQYEKDQKVWRERDLEDWCSAKRFELSQKISQYCKRAKIMEAMKDRKSMAAQQRMKNIADLANDKALTNSASKKRKRNAGPVATIDNDPTDTFGSNDSDWNAYRDISNASLDEEQDHTNSEILRLEDELLEHDPNFHREDTFAVQESFDWRNLVLHKFIHGPRQNLSLAMQIEGHDPEELLNNPEIIRRNHQLHVNIERIRVLEIYFQPHIAGVDQAGIPELIQNLLERNSDRIFEVGGELRAFIENVFLTGGGSLIPNFENRIRAELTSILPVGAPLHVYTAKNPLLDTWRGMQKWSRSKEADNSYVTRMEYEELGPEYIKEHGLGNVCLKDL